MTSNRTDALNETRTRIARKAYELAGQRGWNLRVVEEAALAVGDSRETVKAVFPAGVRDVLAAFSDAMDEAMLASLAQQDTASLGVRQKIKRAVITRWDLMKPYKDGVAAACRYFLVPWHTPFGNRQLWRTADRIWVWAGDTATDYNRYTKRTLLSGVLAMSYPVWLQGDDAKAEAFLEHRLDEVVAIGRRIGSVVGPMLEKVKGRKTA